jgi:tRNA A-37 threonylcarbamoyl transferase component Bud32
MLLIAGLHRPLFAALGLKSFDSIAAAFGPAQRPGRSTVFVQPYTLSAPDGSSLPIFYKQYFHSTPSLAFLGRPSKARRERDSYEVFSRLNLRCAEWIVCGEQRDRIGRLRSAFIITRAVPDAVDLIEFMTKRCPVKSSPAHARARRAVLRQLAEMTRAIHHAGFFHNDLYWRNVLVSCSSPRSPQVWWIDCPRGQFDRWSPWRQRRRLKDLAGLDKCGSQYCTRSERLDFAKTYLGKKSLDAETLTLARDVTRYRRERWPEDWHGR